MHTLICHFSFDAGLLWPRGGFSYVGQPGLGVEGKAFPRANNKSLYNSRAPVHIEINDWLGYFGPRSRLGTERHVLGPTGLTGPIYRPEEKSVITEINILWLLTYVAF